ncbi:MAG: fibrobacter succinogenes major paralogous domain-containing protein [Prolixibacteraceae bacterium]|nr:fibrobacter succinogenes major paralogous domain-containing protein [Prolixibacteraceae bacterium]
MKTIVLFAITICLLGNGFAQDKLATDKREHLISANNPLPVPSNGNQQTALLATGLNQGNLSGQVNGQPPKPGTVSDSDGNTYMTIAIGKQVWMAENLKTTKLNDGTEIPEVIADSAWENLSAAGFCWPKNDEMSWKDTYGALYNWYAVNTEKLCPKGWHVPTDADWLALEKAIGMSEKTALSTGRRGAAMASKLAGEANLWTDGALELDESFGSTGFNALPAGYRGGNGQFYETGNVGNWWSSTEYSKLNAWYRGVYFYATDVARYGLDMRTGVSVRCVKD